MKENPRQPLEWRDEARQKYDPQTVAESERRVAGYSEARWEQVLEEGDVILKALAGLMDHRADAPQVRESVLAYRAYISRSFYECTMEIYKGLGRLYVEDVRFTKNLDRYGEGFARFLSEAIAALPEEI